MVRAIGIGDNVCDKYRHLGKMFPGGQALNFAVYSQLQGHEAAYLGVFGDDAVAAHVIRTLRAIGVDSSRCRQYPGENGYAVIDLQDGERTFVVSNKGGILRTQPLTLLEADLAYIAGFDIVHTSNNSYLDGELSKLASLPNALSYDFSGAWQDERRTRAISGYLDFAFLSCADFSLAEIKAQQVKMRDWGCGMVIATMGSKGAIAYDGAAWHSCRLEPVKATDTLGAGDSLIAGFLLHYLTQRRQSLPDKGAPEQATLVEAALAAGAALAAKTCMMQGAFGYGTELI